MGFGPSGQNPSCLGTLLGPAAHPSLGALRALQLGLRPNKIVEEGGVCAMVTASHSLCSCLQANFHPPYAHPIKLQTDLKPCCDEEYRLTTRCGYCICSHINFLEKEIDLPGRSDEACRTRSHPTDGTWSHVGDRTGIQIII